MGEYAARMKVLQRRREELTAQRQAVEKRLALREATAAEFSAVALQGAKQQWKARREAALASKTRNEQFVRAVREAQRQVEGAWLKTRGQTESSALLEQEKKRYNQRVEQLYPAWQEQLQRQRVQTLRELEEKKRAVERRRYLAKKSFEKEQTLDDMIRKTRHEVEMAEHLEQNELYERELLRTQSSSQAKEVDQTIREVALDARSYLQEQAAKHFDAGPEVDEELGEKLLETFSPRHTLRALREANSSMTFEENQSYEEEEKPTRQIRVEIPARMSIPARSYPQYNNQRAADYDYDTQIYDVHSKVDQLPEQFNVIPDQQYQPRKNRSDENDYSAFKRPAESGPFSNQQPQISAGNVFVKAKDSCAESPSDSEFKQHQNPSTVNTAAASTARQEPHSGSAIIQLPTMVQAKLDPIPEVTEQFSPDKGAVVSANVDLSHVGLNIANKSSEGVRATTEAASSLSTPLPETPSSAPVKLEDRVEILPVDTTPSSTPMETVEQSRPVNDRSQISEIAENAISSASVAQTGTRYPAPVWSVETTTAPLPTLSASSESAASSDDAPRQTLSDLQEEVVTTPREEHQVWDEQVRHEPIQAPIESSTSAQSKPYTDVNEEEKAPEESPQSAGLSADEGQLEDKQPLPVLVNAVDDTANESVLPLQQDENKVDFIEGGISSIEKLEDVLSVKSFSSIESQELGDVLKADGDTEVLAETFNSQDQSSGPNSRRTSGVTAPAPSAKSVSNEMLLTSMQSDDFELSANNFSLAAQPEPAGISTSDTDTAKANTDAANTSSANEMKPAVVPEQPAEVPSESVTEKLSPADRVKALGALISRVEEGATEGDTLGSANDTGSSYESKRELLKMAASGLKAQVAFFGSDICFELILDIARDLGPVLFPPKAFEGIMNDQKIRKLLQSNKQKELDLWKALSNHMKQLVQLKAISAATLVDHFVAAFLAHDPDNQRSKRKLREFLVTLCGGKSSSPARKDSAATSQPPSPAKQEQQAPSPEPAKPREAEGRIGTPALLQTAFLQRQSPPKPKVFGIASSGFKDRSSDSADVLKSMSSGPMKLSQKLMRGGKMNDYSEFEEEEEVDLQNLIGSKPAFASAGRPTKPSPSKAPTQDADEEDEFDF